MSPTFSFMTGARRYRIQAKDIQEAIQIALDELKPDENTRAVILGTIYDEGRVKDYLAGPGDADEPDPEEGTD